MMSISKTLADETFTVVIDGETKSFKIVPEMSSTLRKSLVFWQTEKTDDEDLRKIFLSSSFDLMHLRWEEKYSIQS